MMTDERWAKIEKALTFKMMEAGLKPNDPGSAMVTLRTNWDFLHDEAQVEAYVDQCDLENLQKEKEWIDGRLPAVKQRITDLNAKLKP